MKAEQLVQDLRASPKGRLLLHLLMWMFFLSAMFYLQSISFSAFSGAAVFYAALKQTITTVMAFYALLYWIWPNYWIKKRYLIFVIAICLLIIVYTTVDFWLEQALFEHCAVCMARLQQDKSGYLSLLKRGALNVIFLRLLTFGIVYQMFVFLAFPVTVKVMVAYLDQRLAALELQKQNVRLELNFLKAQVNPHFLFNTLNNIYSQILKDKKEDSAETVARLSTFLRYSLYDDDNHTSNVMREINLLTDYIALEKIRLNDTVVNFVTSVDDEAHSLPPLLFFPAVENAFKYCNQTGDQDAYIFISLNIVNSKLEFRVSNTCAEHVTAKIQSGGIGLANLQKRLTHYFPGKSHRFEKQQEDGIFLVLIQLELL